MDESRRHEIGISLSALDISPTDATAHKQHSPPLLRRSSSWPPALCVHDSNDYADDGVRSSDASELYLDLDYDPDFDFHPAGPILLAPDAPSPQSLESKSLHSGGKSISSSTAPSSEVTLELKKEGFRASVAKRWSLTKQILHDKARLYREYYRAYQQIRHKPDESAGADPPRDADRKDTQPAKRDKEPAKKEPLQGNKPNKAAAATGKITYAPHELSTTFWQADMQEPERGRQQAASKHGGQQASEAIYPKGFSSRGELLVATSPRGKRKSRTASGRRHAWQEPSAAIVPVCEESEASSVKGSGRAEQRHHHHHYSGK